MDSITFTVNTILTYLPLVTRNYVVAPDLVVTSLDVQSGGITVTIANDGNAPVTGEFWVDVYVDPSRVPTRPNETWDMVGRQGMVWGVTAGALPLSPGDALVLTRNDPYYAEAYSHVT